MKFSAFLIPTLLVVSAGLLSACNSASETAPSEPPLRLVKTLTLAAAGDTVWRELPGVVDVDRKADLNFRKSGKLEKLLANEGDVVTSGQVLAQLDATDLKIQLRSREAEYRQVHADYVRSKALVEKGVISRSDFNKLQAQNITAKANLDAAQQDLSYSVLEAPFDGVVAKRHVENFEEVSAAQPIYSLQDPDTLTIKVAVPESMMIQGRKSPPRISAEFPTVPGERFELAQKEVAAQADPNTNTFEVTLSLPDLNGHNILPGMSVTVRGERPAAEIDANENVTFVPAQSVLEDAQGRYVFVVNPTESGRGVVERRSVSTGRLTGNGIAIHEGLEIGNRIVIAGMSKMRTGLEVRTAAEEGQ